MRSGVDERGAYTAFPLLMRRNTGRNVTIATFASGIPNFAEMRKPVKMTRVREEDLVAASGASSSTTSTTINTTTSTTTSAPAATGPRPRAAPVPADFGFHPLRRPRQQQARSFKTPVAPQRVKFKKPDWEMVDASGSKKYLGVHEPGLLESHYLLLAPVNNEFHGVEVDDWFKFQKKRDYRTLSLEEAEMFQKSSLRTDQATSRWLMRLKKDGGEGADKPSGPAGDADADAGPETKRQKRIRKKREKQQRSFDFKESFDDDDVELALEGSSSSSELDDIDEFDKGDTPAAVKELAQLLSRDHDPDVGPGTPPPASGHLSPVPGPLVGGGGSGATGASGSGGGGGGGGSGGGVAVLGAPPSAPPLELIPTSAQPRRQRKSREELAHEDEIRQVLLPWLDAKARHLEHAPALAALMKFGKQCAKQVRLKPLDPTTLMNKFLLKMKTAAWGTTVWDLFQATLNRIGFQPNPDYTSGTFRGGDASVDRPAVVRVLVVFSAMLAQILESLEASAPSTAQAGKKRAAPAVAVAVVVSETTLPSASAAAGANKRTKKPKDKDGSKRPTKRQRTAQSTSSGGGATGATSPRGPSPTVDPSSSSAAAAVSTVSSFANPTPAASSSAAPSLPEPSPALMEEVRQYLLRERGPVTYKNLCRHFKNHLGTMENGVFTVDQEKNKALIAVLKKIARMDKSSGTMMIVLKQEYAS